MKLLIGGSPCTHWSVAQSKDRETQPKGIGWDFFENYLIAKAKFHPDYFLYENNKSMAAPIREQITRELGVEPILINSALVSAQTRQRLYWTNIPGVKQPEDRGIVIRDILEIGKDGVRNMVGNTVNRRTYIAQPICVNSKSGRNGIPGLQPSIEHRIYSIDGKGTAVNFPDTIQLGDAFQVRDTPHIALFSHQRSDVQDAWGNEVPGEGAAV